MKIWAVGILLLLVLLACGQIPQKGTLVLEQFKLPQLERTRTVAIYLPPTYFQETNKCYPVIYMQDGQNLFEDSLSFSGEWGVDESMDSIYRANGFEAIVVGIYNGGEHRISELTPFPNAKYGGGEGRQFLDFMDSTLRPSIEKEYRVNSRRENTAVIGSSLGGLHAFYTGFKSNGYSKVAALSPSFWFSDRIYSVVHASGDLKIYLSIGEAEDTTGEALDGAIKMDAYLKANGFKENQLKFVRNPQAKHNEKQWRREFPRAVCWLFDLH